MHQKSVAYELEKEQLVTNVSTFQPRYGVTRAVAKSPPLDCLVQCSYASNSGCKQFDELTLQLQTSNTEIAVYKLKRLICEIWREEVNLPKIKTQKIFEI